ncbi:MAG: hypothetical protein Q8R70_07740 [Methanoregula sp.]|nr:hypothetical protein [Methanoregula sp.]
MKKTESDLKSHYPVKDGKVLLEIKLSSPAQILNPFSPVPFHEKELTNATEEYIENTVRDFPDKTRFRIVLYLPASIIGTPEVQALPEVVRNHFQYKVMDMDRKQRHLMKFVRNTIFTGFIVLAICIFISTAILKIFGDSLPVVFIASSIEILGQIAIWSPLIVFMFQMWPLREAQKLYQKITGMEIVVEQCP